MRARTIAALVSPVHGAFGRGSRTASASGGTGIVAAWESVTAMPYWRLYYHAVWATKNREPVIDDGMIAPIVQAIEQTVCDPGVIVFAVGVMPEHVYVSAQIPRESERLRPGLGVRAESTRATCQPGAVWRFGTRRRRYRLKAGGQAGVVFALLEAR